MRTYPKHDYILGRDLTPRERLEPQRNEIQHVRNMLDSFELRFLQNVPGDLSEQAMRCIADALDQVYYAVLNAHQLGASDYNPYPLRVIRWEDYAEGETGGHA